ncbi:hypothetical protein ACP70R_022741 [Stipagrostis hirtigluma subsp. patula]
MMEADWMAAAAGRIVVVAELAMLHLTAAAMALAVLAAMVGTKAAVATMMGHGTMEVRPGSIWNTASATVAGVALHGALAMA